MNRLTRALLSALPLIVFAACDSGVEQGPSLHPQQAVSAGSDMSPLAKYRNGPPVIVIGFAMKTICPAGGTISLIGFQVDVPPNAVSKCTNFTIRLPVDPKNSSYVYAQFGPHGQKFNVPVTLTLPFKGTTADGGITSNVLWYDGTTWIELPSVLTTDGRIQTKTNHFSDYGTEELTPSKGVQLAGG